MYMRYVEWDRKVLRPRRSINILERDGGVILRQRQQRWE